MMVPKECIRCTITVKDFCLKCPHMDGHRNGNKAIVGHDWVNNGVQLDEFKHKKSPERAYRFITSGLEG